jgi:hypothetical protein
MELGLVQLIRQLKIELGELQLTPNPLFSIEAVDVELKFVVEKSVDAGGKAHWILYAAEAKGQYKNQHINTIKLTLRPLVGSNPLPGLLVAHIPDKGIINEGSA